ncbi:ROK family protein [Chryseosolibacter indicus]|uniref:ROK family protein n=1 Tax=Chryseosolibacter indicus TaxID=2782351 RepID=UPI0020B43550
MKVAVGIDMGGTKIKLGLIREGAIIAQSSLAASSHINLIARLAEIADKVDEMLAENNAEPTGIGIAFPGIIDSTRYKVLSKYVKYPDSQGVNFSRWAIERWNIPVALENDAKAALIGEWQFGNGRGSNNLLLITLGTGVGSAVMIDGRLLSGRNFTAGNLGGHMTINVHGKVCNCGNIGCVETEGSTWALADQVKNAPDYTDSSLSKESNIDFKHLFTHAANGDRLAQQVQDKCLKTWSLGIINLIHAFDPDRVVIGGGIMESHHILLPYIHWMITRHSWVKDNPPELVAAAHPQTAGMLGMYHLLIQGKKTLTSIL